METKLEHVKGVGPQTIKYFRNTGIWSTYDLVLRYPKRYEDYSITSLEHAHHKELITVKAKVISPLKLIRGHKTIRIVFQAQVFDQIVDVITFGRGYLVKQIAVKDVIMIKGTYDLYKQCITTHSIIKAPETKTLKPIYDIDQVHDKTVSQIMRTIFDENLVQVFETLPKEILEQHHFVTRDAAYQLLHFPTSFKDIDQALERLKFEEAFYLQLKLISKQPMFHLRAPKKYDIDLVKSLITELPYELTKDQKEAVNDIFRDFKKNKSTFRLIQGDVGSGKTLVALIAIYAVITAGEQVSIMAPTELLAQQHFQYFKSYLKNARIALLTGKTKHKDVLKEKIKNHDIDLVIGTQALIENDVIFDNLGFVVIDEQHKFGVKTREELIEKSMTKDVLYLTATPIPRTLAMMIFGNQHVSIIKEKPKDRQAIQTKYITKQTISEMYDMMHSALIRKEHIFLVVPAITSEKVTDNIHSVYQEISAEFTNAALFVLHGQLQDDEKTRVMENFIYTPGSILIATTMIEVGLDIPTATLIGIYAAENFGLSQLHQLRGRVGRGHLPSFCYLISEKDDIERLKTLSTSQDGFKLAEFDLLDRGPGDFLGSDQSGYLDFKFLSLVKDYPILIEAQKEVDYLISRPDFKSNPQFRYLNRYMTGTIKL